MKTYNAKKNEFQHSVHSPTAPLAMKSNVLPLIDCDRMTIVLQ